MPATMAAWTADSRTVGIRPVPCRATASPVSTTACELRGHRFGHSARLAYAVRIPRNTCIANVGTRSTTT